MDKSNHIYIKVLAVFFLFVLFLTFFSKSIYNYNLPEASIAFPMKGELNHDVEGRAEVTYKNMSDVFPDCEGRVSEVRAASGSYVNEGDVIIVLNKIEEDAKVEVKAPRSGVIIKICVSEGMYVSAVQNESLFQMAEPNGYWRSRMFISDETASILQIGNTASIEIKGVPEDISGTIVSIDSVEKDGVKQYSAAIEFAFENQDIAGKMADIVIGRDGEQFDTILPAYALQKDSKGYFVWTIREESNILGKHYVVHRLSVDLQDTDNTAVLVIGINSDTPIVTSCTEELEEGVRVAYKESENDD